MHIPPLWEVPVRTVLTSLLVAASFCWLCPTAIGQTRIQLMSRQQIVNELKDLKAEVSKANSRIAQLESTLGSFATRANVLGTVPPTISWTRVRG